MNALCELATRPAQPLWTFDVYGEPNCETVSHPSESFGFSAATEDTICFNITSALNGSITVQSFVFQAAWPWVIRMFEGGGCQSSTEVVPGMLSVLDS